MPSPVFVPQAYAPIYCAINGEAQTEVHQIDLDMDSGATDVETIMRQWAGVVQGAARIDFTIRAIVPFTPTDTGGTGFGVSGATAAGIPLAQTMITTINQNQNTPCSFAFGIGGFTAAVPNTQLVARGFIKKAVLTYSVKGTPEITYSGTAQFTFFE
jgi:hypothetical protein